MTAVVAAAPFPTVADPQKYAIQAGISVSTSGSTVINGYSGCKELNLVINVKTSPTGTSNPQITYSIQDVDPGDGTTLVGTAVVGAPILGISVQVLTFVSLTGSVKVSWSVIGTTPVFPNVYSTLVAKVGSIVSLYDPSGNLGGASGGGVTVLPASSTASALNPALVVALSPSTPTPAGSNTIGNVTLNNSSNTIGTVNLPPDIFNTGTISAAGGSVGATTSGYTSVVVGITGTFSAAGGLAFQGLDPDNSTWRNINGIVPTTGQIVSSTTTVGYWKLSCAGYRQLRVFGTVTSGTANVNFYSSVGGPNLVSLETMLPSGTNTMGGVVLVDTGLSNKLNILASSTAPLLTNTAVVVTQSPNAPATYSASTVDLASAASATDIFTIIGSASKTVFVKRIKISATATGASVTNIFLIKRSTADTGGTSTAPTAVPHDSSSAAAGAVLAAYTANPTTGTPVGTLRIEKLPISTPASASIPDSLLWDFGTLAQGGIALRGVTQQLAVNLNSTTITGSAFSIWIEWTETT